MAAKNPSSRFPTAAPKPVFIDGFDGVLAARRIEPTRASQQWTEPYLIATNKKNCDFFGHRRLSYGSKAFLSFRTARVTVFRIDLSTVAKDPWASRLGRTINSTPWGKPSRWVRKDSRIQRFQRLRTTAFPVFFGMLIPSFAGEFWAPNAHLTLTTSTSSAAYSPWRMMTVKSSLFTIRADFGKDNG